MLIGGDILGIGLSLDGGETWQGTYGLRCWEIEDFAWRATNASTVWAGTMGGPYVMITVVRARRRGAAGESSSE